MLTLRPMRQSHIKIKNTVQYRESYVKSTDCLTIMWTPGEHDSPNYTPRFKTKITATALSGETSKLALMNKLTAHV